uniref:Uncharacterized protein n=1 Tax=Calcidiscus leptoporus TaxID=127549 RepID=A0A7S0P551_9EUKA|mmetsp:Transcript_56174/g.128964  ORF Transcript_56174/g.128964 Transcript_56174/m.128964 type:complete len:177 (+) Transcript_56174:58-588(+)
MLSLLTQTIGFASQPPSFAYDGEWCDQFGTYLKVTDAAITGRGAGGFDLMAPPGYTNPTVSGTRHHNGEEVAEYFAQNRDVNSYNPGLFSRFDWTTDHDNKVYMCQSVYDADSTDTATNAETADVNDLDGVGCGGAFPWSALTPKEEGLCRKIVDLPNTPGWSDASRKLYWADASL